MRSVSTTDKIKQPPDKFEASEASDSMLSGPSGRQGLRKVLKTLQRNNLIQIIKITGFLECRSKGITKIVQSPCMPRIFYRSMLDRALRRISQWTPPAPHDHQIPDGVG